MNEHPVVPFAKLCRDIAPSPFASRDWINLPCHRCTSRFLFSGNGLSHRKKHKHNLVHRLVNTGIDTARSGAQSEVPSAILDASQHLHGDRLLDHALLRLQYHKVEWYLKSWCQTVLHRRATTPLFRDCDIRHRRYRRCKFSIHVNLLAFHFAVLESVRPNSSRRCSQVMPVSNNMQHPSHFLGCPSVLNVTMSIVVALYTLMGIFGYLAYGEHSMASITLNIPTEEEWVNHLSRWNIGTAQNDKCCFSLAQAVKLLIAVAVLFTYGLQYFVPLEIIWNAIKHLFSHKYEAIGETLMRVGMVMLTGKCILHICELKQRDKLFLICSFWRICVIQRNN